MALHLARASEVKRTYRSALAARPLGEKPRTLNALRESELDIRGRSPHSKSNILYENPATHRTKPE